MKKEKMLSIAAVVFIIVLAVIFLAKDELISIASSEIVLNDVSFVYSSYSIVDESAVKKLCPYVRVGRCIGGGVAEECSFNSIELKYEISDLSSSELEKIECYAISDGANLGTSKFSESDSLTFKIDVRKINPLSVCCQAKGEDVISSEICLPEVKINAIC